MYAVLDLNRHGTRAIEGMSLDTYDKFRNPCTKFLNFVNYYIDEDLYLPLCFIFSLMSLDIFLGISILQNIYHGILIHCILLNCTCVKISSSTFGMEFRYGSSSSGFWTISCIILDISLWGQYYLDNLRVLNLRSKNLDTFWEISRSSSEYKTFVYV